MRFDPKSFVPWIRSAAPYIHALRGKTLVIAFGGEVVADETFLGEPRGNPVRFAHTMRWAIGP